MTSKSDELAKAAKQADIELSKLAKEFESPWWLPAKQDLKGEWSMILTVGLAVAIHLLGGPTGFWLLLLLTLLFFWLNLLNRGMRRRNDGLMNAFTADMNRAQHLLQEQSRMIRVLETQRARDRFENPWDSDDKPSVN